MGLYSRKSKDGKSIWYIDFYFEGRRVRERIGESKTQAKAVLAKRKGEIVSGKYQLIQNQKTPRFDLFCNDYFAWAKLNKKSWKRDRSSLKNLKNYFGGRRLAEITTWDVEQYKQMRVTDVGKRSAHPASATINRELACLKKMYSLAIKWGKAFQNPAKSVSLLKESAAGRRLSHAEQDALINACNDTLRPLVIFALNTGKRLGEILNLQWNDVNTKLWQITIRESKSGDSWIVPVNSTVQSLILELP